jgi:hypothetical protein
MRGWSGTLLIGLALATSEARGQGEITVADIFPAGFGTLNHDQLSVRFVAGDVEVRLLPLDERVLRLVAPDGYESLHGLVQARQAQIDSAAAAAGVGNPGLALVSFFALRDDARFDPQNVSLFYHNQFYRPVAIIPITATFTARQLPVRRQASGIYLFEVPVPVFEQFDIAYGAIQSKAWNDILPRVERERGRVLARAQAARDTAISRP